MDYNKFIHEHDLLQQLAEGDRNAFRMLYEHYSNKVFFYVLRFTESRDMAADILQEVFIRLWIEREKMKDIRSLDAWLFTVAKHKLINGFRKLSLEHAAIAEIGNRTQEPVDFITHSVDYNDTRRALQTAIDQLPPQQKIIYRLCREQGMKNDEIASKLNISPLTVKKHIAQASRSIRTLLAKQAIKPVSLLAWVFSIFQ